MFNTIQSPIAGKKLNNHNITFPQDPDKRLLKSMWKSDERLSNWNGLWEIYTNSYFHAIFPMYEKTLNFQVESLVETDLTHLSKIWLIKQIIEFSAFLQPRRPGTRYLISQEARSLVFRHVNFYFLPEIS